MDRFPAFRDLLPADAFLAAEKGHEYMDHFHCFAAITRYHSEAPGVRAALAARPVSVFEDELWNLVKTQKALRDIMDVSPNLLVMIDSVIGDVSCLAWGATPMLGHIAMFFLTRPTCVPYAVYDRFAIDRQETIKNAAKEMSHDLWKTPIGR